MTYGSDAASTHLSNAYWYLDTGDMHPVDPSAENMTAMTNRESPFVGTGLARVGKYSYLVANKVSYLTCPVPRAPILAAGRQVADQVDQDPTQLLSDEKEFRFKDRFQIFGRPITGQARQAEPPILFVHNATLKNKGRLERYNLTRFALKTFTFAAGSISHSIDNAVLGPSRNVCCSPWLRIQILTVRWTTILQISALHKRILALCER